MEEQREVGRSGYRRKVIFGPTDSPGCLGYTKDISKTGVFIMTSRVFSVGTVLSLVINDDGRIVKNKGVVARVAGDEESVGGKARSGLGIRFLGVKEEGSETTH